MEHSNARTLFVDQKHLESSDQNDGSSERPFKTIGAAASEARPGDTVLIRSGVYRERVIPARGGRPDAPIIYQSADPGTTIIKGSDIWSPKWRAVDQANGIFEAPLPNDLVNGPFNPFAMKMPAHVGSRSYGEIFLDGQPLREADSEDSLVRSSGAWRAIDNGAAIRYRPVSESLDADKLVYEISVRPYVFAPKKRGLGYILIHDLTIEHCANGFPENFWSAKDGHPQAGAISTRSGHHWSIRNCSISFCKGIGIDCGAEGGKDPEGTQPQPKKLGHHLIEDCVVDHCGVCGIAGWMSPSTTIRRNIVRWCNRLGFFAPEAAGIKTHKFFGGVITDNFLYANDAFGIWVDNGFAGCRVSRNLCLSNRGAGVFIEMGHGPCLVDHNICGLTARGEGIYAHDASGVTIAHNLLFNNAHLGIYLRKVTERSCTNRSTGSDQEVESSNNRVIGNLLIDNYRGQISIPIESDKSRNNFSDCNIFISGSAWQWEGAALDKFYPNTNDGRIPKDALATAMSRIRKQLDPEALAIWMRDPRMDIVEWRRVTEWDLNSLTISVERGEIEVGAIAKGACGIAPLDATVHFRDGKEISRKLVPPIDQVDLDFYGIPLDNSPRTVGPFNEIKEGLNIFPLYPRAKNP